MTTDPTIRRAFIHGSVTVALALGALIAGGAADGTTRTVLLAACPLITLIGAVAAGIRTYRAWKVNNRWPVWQGSCGSSS